MSGNTADSKTESAPSEDAAKPEAKEVLPDSGAEQRVPSIGAQDGSIDDPNEVRGGKLIMINASLCLCTLLVGLVSPRLPHNELSRERAGLKVHPVGLHFDRHRDSAYYI